MTDTPIPGRTRIVAACVFAATFFGSLAVALAKIPGTGEAIAAGVSGSLAYGAATLAAYLTNPDKTPAGPTATPVPSAMVVAVEGPTALLNSGQRRPPPPSGPGTPAASNVAEAADAAPVPAVPATPSQPAVTPPPAAPPSAVSSPAESPSPVFDDAAPSVDSAH